MDLSRADSPAALAAALRGAGYALTQPSALRTLTGVAVADLEPLARSWERLPPDDYLRDGGRYRFRRHGSFVLELPAATLAAAPPRAHWQSTDYNALHGGIERWFAPLEPAIAGAPVFRELVARLGALFASVREVPRWYVEAHQFRIDTASGIGRPTPEGAHRDGVDFVALLLLSRRGVRGGETRVFDAAGPAGVRFTMAERGEMLLMDDTRVVHETTPIQPAEAGGLRDTLVLTYRAGGFQQPNG